MPQAKRKRERGDIYTYGSVSTVAYPLIVSRFLATIVGSSEGLGDMVIGGLEGFRPPLNILPVHYSAKVLYGSIASKRHVFTCSGKIQLNMTPVSPHMLL